ncbi:MAG: hypothetical protein M1831_000172 [Alyxoria varia]|nr:MAG: hypothetical protein M1831_000172 [Alyxoria varia]
MPSPRPFSVHESSSYNAGLHSMPPRQASSKTLPSVKGGRQVRPSGSHQPGSLRNKLRQIKAAFLPSYSKHTATSPARDHSRDKKPIQDSSDQNDNQARPKRAHSLKKRRSTLLMTRPWCALTPMHLPHEPPREPPPVPELPKNLDQTLVSLDPTHGAAARQSVRDLKSGSQAIVRHDSTHDQHQVQPRDSESGVCVSMENCNLGDGQTETSSTVKLDPVQHLPEELASLILSHLSAPDLATSERVSRAWRRLAKDPHLWKNVFVDTFGKALEYDALPAAMGGKGLGKRRQHDQEWKLMYLAREQLSFRWKAGSGTAIYLYGHTDSVYCAQFDEDKVVTGSRDRTVRVWDVKTGRLNKVIGVPSAFARDKERPRQEHTFPGETPGIRVHQQKPQELTRDLYHTPEYYHNASILCLQYDDRILVTGSSDCTLIVWDIKTWMPLRRLERHRAGVLDIAFDKEKIISCSKDGSICVWDRETGALLKRMLGHHGPVNAVQLRGNLIVSASGEGCAKLWRITIDNPGTRYAHAEAKCVRDFWSKDRGLACVEFSEDARYILSGGNDQVIYKFDTSTGELCKTMRGHGSLVRSLYLDGANNRVVSGSYDFSLRVWDFDTGKPTWTFPSWATSWMLSAKSDYRRIVSTNQDGRALIIDFGVGVKDAELLHS